MGRHSSLKPHVFGLLPFTFPVKYKTKHHRTEILNQTRILLDIGVSFHRHHRRLGLFHYYSSLLSEDECKTTSSLP